MHTILNLENSQIVDEIKNTVVQRNTSNRNTYLKLQTYSWMGFKNSIYFKKILCVSTVNRNSDLYHHTVKEFSMNADLLMYVILRVYLYFSPSCSQIVSRIVKLWSDFPKYQTLSSSVRFSHWLQLGTTICGLYKKPQLMPLQVSTISTLEIC